MTGIILVSGLLVMVPPQLTEAPQTITVKEVVEIADWTAKCKQARKALVENLRR